MSDDTKHDHDHGHDDHGHGAGGHGHDDHGHGGGHGGHGGQGHDDHGHDDHGHHEQASAFEYILWALGIVFAIALGVVAVGQMSGFPAGSASEWVTIPKAATVLLVLPLFAFATQMFVGSYLGRPAHFISLGAIYLSCVLGTWILLSMLRGDSGGLQYINPVVDWFKVGDPAHGGSQFRFGYYIDGLTAGMLFIVTFIGGLVHVYSTGYMDGDPRYSRFFGYLSIFCFSMLGLVLSDNLFGLYCFWELVGLSSYLLIGFWFEKNSAADACKKAFLTNRVGDIGFFFGLAMLFKWTGTLQYTELFHRLPIALNGNPLLSEPLHPFGLNLGNSMPTPITLAGILLFCGAIGKSAQFPLHIWLPDAMEGPTPVSALIHAATMVAAGVFMVARLYPVFSPGALMFISYIGLITAFFAGTIAIAQYDIKRVLAYSTVSQLGYMISALGVGGYTAGLFHLTTHAFFKALLFLCSGAVIHSVHTQDMREMGGLWKKIPWTAAAMTIGTVAICGLPFTSGFYSKDAILEAMWDFAEHSHGHWAIFGLALLAAGVTSFYSFRLIIMTFLGEPRDRAKYDAAHESPPAMVAPLILLSVLAIVSAYHFNPESREAGYWARVPAPEQLSTGTPSSEQNRFTEASRTSGLALLVNWGQWYGGVIRRPDHVNGAEGMPVVAFFEAKYHKKWGGEFQGAAEGEEHAAGEAHEAEKKPAGMPGFLPIVVVFTAIAFSFICFYFKMVTLEGIEEMLPPVGVLLRALQVVLANKYFVDEIYVLVFVRPFLFLNQCLWTFDATVIDGVVNGFAAAGRHLSALCGQFDLYVVDGLANLLADFTVGVGDKIRGLQDGVVQDYLVSSFWVVVLALIGLQLMGG